VASDPRDAQKNGEDYVALLLKYGASAATWIPIDVDHIDNADNDKVIGTIANCTGYFFGGGDQERLIMCFYNKTRKQSGALKMIWKRFNEGAAISGSSAGLTIQQEDEMVTGGETYEGMVYGPYKYGDKVPNDDYMTYDENGGFGFFEYGLLDSHFSERGRQGRLIRLAWHAYANYAFGVDQNTALVVRDIDNEIKMEVIGEAGVFIFDLSQAYANTTTKYWSIIGIKSSYLTENDEYIPFGHCVFC